ncbi:MAG: universal stress protein [Pseudomonadota bacterium]
MSKSVLAAIDLNREEAGGPVLRRAAELAKMDGASLSVITVIPDFGQGFVASFLPEDAMAQAMEDAAERLRLYVDRVLPNHPATRHVAEGTVHHEVLDCAARIGADLIVVGTHEPTVTDLLIGPNAAHIVRHAKVSVLVVR